MSQEYWRKVEELFHRALEFPRDRRQAYRGRARVEMHAYLVATAYKDKSKRRRCWALILLKSIPGLMRTSPIRIWRRHATTTKPWGENGSCVASSPGTKAGNVGSPHTVIPAEFSDETRVELQKIRAAVKLARSLKIKPNAGHGLNYDNVAPIAAIPGISWLHIGHAIVARSLITGMERAVREMLKLINHGR
jgi:pyridoxine 5'-phosphate synthase PdxJ